MMRLNKAENWDSSGNGERVEHRETGFTEPEIEGDVTSGFSVTRVLRGSTVMLSAAT